jgi:hypothetical protein
MGRGLPVYSWLSFPELGPKPNTQMYHRRSTPVAGFSNILAGLRNGRRNIRDRFCRIACHHSHSFKILWCLQKHRLFSDKTHIERAIQLRQLAQVLSRAIKGNGSLNFCMMNNCLNSGVLCQPDSI